jgi:V/A-type H+-transporting ATPase subunit K
MNFGLFGVACALGLSAVGSGIGAGIAGQAAIGAWKRNYLQNKPASFLLVAFAGAPLTQTIYGFILLNAMKAAAAAGTDPWLLLGLGVASGSAIGYSAVAQGMASASGCDAFGETSKGFGQYIIIVGLCETVALFVMAFSLGVLG